VLKQGTYLNLSTKKILYFLWTLHEKQEGIRMNAEYKMIKASAKIIFSDVFAVIAECIRVGSAKGRPTGIAVGSDYPKHISNILYLLTSDEIAILYKIYGHIERLKTDYFKMEPLNAFDTTGRVCKNVLDEWDQRPRSLSTYWFTSVCPWAPQ
jgi:hypothetical protein